MITKGQLVTLLLQHDKVRAEQLRLEYGRQHHSLTLAYKNEHQFIKELREILDTLSKIEGLGDGDPLPCFVEEILESTLGNYINGGRPLRDEETKKTIALYKDQLARSKMLSHPQKLFEYIVRGQLSAARLIVREDLLSTQEHRTRLYSGKIIFAKHLDYAMWARDMAFCRMLVEHLSVEAAAEQLQDFENFGLRGYGYCFNLTPYINACKNFLGHVDRYGEVALLSDSAFIDNPIHQQSIRLFREIGVAQLDFPAHYIHLMCRPEKPLIATNNQIPSFDRANLPDNAVRTFVIKSADNSIQSVYELDIDSNHGLGWQTLIRYNLPNPILVSHPFNNKHILPGIKADYNAICAFQASLEAEYELFKESILAEAQIATFRCT